MVDLESFFPGKDRFALAMRLNNLLAAPGFAAWLEGEPLEVGIAPADTPAGKPRVSIFSIAHLSDAERMFFVTLLLNQTLAWMRAQSGTTSLRAILYMDEIVGYFPPVATPPAKAPLLTLLKQGRAFGLGVVLATQNPVDLDYKGLSNTGTWFLGRLQTERDKARVLEGLEGAAASARREGLRPRRRWRRRWPASGSRVFLLNNVHEDAPEVFETRWALSYLRGPLTRPQIKTLMDPRRGSATPAAGGGAKKAADVTQGEGGPRPILPREPPAALRPGARTQTDRPVPGSTGPALGEAEVHFADAKTRHLLHREARARGRRRRSAGLGLGGGARLRRRKTSRPSPRRARVRGVPERPRERRARTRGERTSPRGSTRERTLAILRSPSTREASRPGESEADFRARLQQGSREARDAALDALRAKYAPRQAALQERLRRAEQAVGREKQDVAAAGIQTAISVGATVLSALFGRKTISSTTIGKATTAARSAGRTMKQAGDVGRANETVEAVQGQIRDLDAELQAELAAARAAGDPVSEKLETLTLRPKKTDVTVRRIALVWTPAILRGDGLAAVPGGASPYEFVPAPARPWSASARRPS